MKKNIEYVELDVNIENYPDDLDDISFSNESNEYESNYSNITTMQTSHTAIRTGIRVDNLQTAMDNYATNMNLSAIAKSTGKPVRTNVEQYKGFAAEEFYKNTLKINSLADGQANYKLTVVTKGKQPDGSVLSGIDMETDIAIWTKNNPLDNSQNTKNYQSKMHNNAKDYAKDLENNQYSNVDFVGGAGQGVNDKITVQIGNKTITSDSLTPEEAKQLAQSMKDQATPEYAKSQEKFDHLHNVNLLNAVKTGAFVGGVLSGVEELIYLIKNHNNLSQEDFINAFQNVMLGTAEGGIRSGLIVESMYQFSKLTGNQFSYTSYESIPAMALANTTVDFAKDLYKCFFQESIDVDDLLCNTVDNAFSSTLGFSGHVIGTKIAGQVLSSNLGNAAAGNIISMVTAKTSAEIGATIGSLLGPAGTILGSAIGAFVFGVGAQAIINTANEDAIIAYNQMLMSISEQMEEDGLKKYYYFADAASSLSDFKLSFKNLLPCYNLISDLREYNILKKSMKTIEDSLQKVDLNIDQKYNQILNDLKSQHYNRLTILENDFRQRKSLLYDDFASSMNQCIADSYSQYLSVYDIIHASNKSLIYEIRNTSISNAKVINELKNRNEVNNELNIVLSELIQNSNNEVVMEFINKVMAYMQTDTYIINRQFVSYEEVLNLLQKEDYND